MESRARRATAKKQTMKGNLLLRAFDQRKSGRSEMGRRQNGTLRVEPLRLGNRNTDGMSVQGYEQLAHRLHVTERPSRTH